MARTKLKPKQIDGIAFRARRTTTWNTTANTQTTNFNFDAIDYNYGSGYNATTGDFTAPIDGIYNFCGTFDLEGVGNMSRGFIVYRGTVGTNYKPRSSDFTVGTGGNQSRFNWTLEIPMTAGQTIGFEIWTSSATNVGRNAFETWVAGRLVMAT